MTDNGGSPPLPPPPPPLPPPPPPRDKGKAKVEEPAGIVSDDDQSGRDPPDPGSRNNPADDREVAAIVRVPINLKPRPKVMPLKGTCLTLKLSPIEVLEPHPKLNLSSDEAFLLTENNEILRDPPIRFSRDLIVFDASDRRYDMNISNHESGSLSRFHVNTEWHEFVRARKVRERSEVWFYRLLDDVSGQLYYRLEVFQIPESRPPTRKNVPRRQVESSDPTEDEKKSCLSRSLTLHEVEPANPVLYLYPEEAYDLTGCKDLLRTPSASFSKTLHVNDDFDRTYNLRLSPYFVSKDWAGYSISGDWGDFVRANNLEACDLILFYNHSLGSTSDKDCYYYDLKVIRKEPELAVVKIDNKVLSAYNTLCFPKTLSKYEGVHDGGKPRLFLDASGDMFEKEQGSPKTVLDSTKYELEKMMDQLYELELFQNYAQLNVKQKDDKNDTTRNKELLELGNVKNATKSGFKNEQTSAACLLEEKVKQDPLLELEGGIKDPLSIKNDIVDLEHMTDMLEKKQGSANTDLDSSTKYELEYMDQLYQLELFKYNAQLKVKQANLKQDALPGLEGANKDLLSIKNDFADRVEFSPTEIKNLQDFFTMLIVKIRELEEQSLTFSNNFNKLTDSFESCLKLALQEKDLFSENTRQKMDHIQLAVKKLSNNVLELRKKQEVERVQHVEQCLLAEKKTRKLESKIQSLNVYLKKSEENRITSDTELENLSWKYRDLDDEYRELVHGLKIKLQEKQDEIDGLKKHSHPAAVEHGPKKPVFIIDNVEYSLEQIAEAHDELENVLVFPHLIGRMSLWLTGLLLTLCKGSNICEGIDKHFEWTALIFGVLLMYNVVIPPCVINFVVGIFGVKLGVGGVKLPEIAVPRIIRLLMPIFARAVLKVGLILGSAYIMEPLKDICSVSIIISGSVSMMLLADFLVAEEVGFVEVGVSAATHAGLSIAKGSSCCFVKMLFVAIVAYLVEKLNRYLIGKIRHLRHLLNQAGV